MLALSEDGSTFHPRYGCESYELCEDCVRSVWASFRGRNRSNRNPPLWRVAPSHSPHPHRQEALCGRGRVRHLPRRLGRRGNLWPARRNARNDRNRICAAVIAPWGVSGVRGLAGFETGEIVMPEPNTNLMVPRTLLPTMRATLPAGDSVLVSAVLGTVTGGRERWENPPTEVRYDGTMD